MKSIKEKAKRHDGNYKTYTELINRLEDVKDAIKKQNYGIAMDILCKPYPEYQITTPTELAESEDEMIRKEIKNFLSRIMLGQENFLKEDYDWNAWMAWLEKQGEQKPTDKVEPKFHEGEWISGYYTNYKVLSVNNEGYVVEDVDGNKINILFENEKFHHLFTIADAKDGDVLCCESGWTCIFKTLANDETFSSYCFMDNTKWFCETGSESHTLNKDFMKAYNGEIKPATKEQRDLLFQRMKEAGYEWDAEKKLLKKIEQKPAWSEEDEKVIHCLEYTVKHFYEDEDTIKWCCDWFKSIKDRVQPKQEWSEDTQQWIDAIIFDYESWYHADKDHRTTIQAKINILKSLKDRYTWKPSDEQMDALLSEVTAWTKGCPKQIVLESLYNDIKKLKS